MRIQGTDGIRRPTSPDNAARVKGLSPLDAFLKGGLITPSFMELYAYSFLTDLSRLERISPGESVVVGWDPRDPKGEFIEAFVSGIRKAGASVLSLGIIPTPAVPAYMLRAGAAGGAMITASHNLKDQNGVKLFWKEQGLKYLPQDDVRLTRVILELAKSTDLREIAPAGEVIDRHEDASSMFKSFMLDPTNSWLEPGSMQELDLDRIDLVVDTANGCLSKFAGNLFRNWGFTNVHEVNTSLAGDVNEGGGVAALEGTEIISRADVFATEGGSGSPFSEHQAVLQMFRLADERRQEFLSGTRLLVAAVFDADGDRFFRLDYSPHKDALIVTSGDEAAFLQAKYLVESRSVSGRPRIVHTVESDINVGAFADESLGVSPVMTAVGDKWVLYEAFAALIEGRLELLKRTLAELDREDAIKELESADRKLASIRSQRSSDSQDYFDLENEVETVQSKHLSPDQIIELEKALLEQGAIPYLMGFEETGHSIAPAILEFSSTANCQLPTANRLFFAGNGLKAAINTFVATQTALKSMDVEAFHEMMEAPFPRGFKRTFYAYYTRKEEFAFGTDYWHELALWLEYACQTRFGAEFDVRRKEFAEELDMVFISLSQKGSSMTAASVFVRNSGTEEKTGVNVRGPKSLAASLDAVGDLARRRLQTTLKDPSSEYAKAETRTLREMIELERQGKALSVGLAVSLLNERHPDVVPERLLLEMFKQDLITLESLTASAAPLKTTDLGRWLAG
ncbi:MAG: hypothetical protein JW941_02435 [Candidatus Coatesbacteria bacterium]|nr:hypothetical protein [Candidatus Coatesbacteria bacterium]